MPAANIADPQRPFKLALRSTRLLGIASTGFGLVILIAFGFLNRLPQFRFAFSLFSMVWLLPGVGFLLAAIMMKDRRRWAVVVAMIAAGVQLPLAIGAFVANFLFPPMSPVPIVLSVAWIAALIQLLIHLKQSLSAVNTMSGDRIHGFEMVLSQPLAAIPMDQSSESDLPK